MTIGSARRTTWAVAAAGLVTALAIRAKRRRRYYDFSGRSVVITGGSRGIGRMIAAAFGLMAAIFLFLTVYKALEIPLGDAGAWGVLAGLFLIAGALMWSKRRKDEIG